MRHCFFLLCALLPIACATTLPPRLPHEPPPPRPPLAHGADTNSAEAYHQQGLRWLETDLELAADAFYWAIRLDPELADPYYARRTALHALNLERVGGYLRSEKYGDGSPVVDQIDSLLYEAMLRDPFLHLRFEHDLMSIAIRKATRARRWIAPGSLRGIAWSAYMRGDFALAVEALAEAIEQDTADFTLHLDRARSFYLMQEYDSTVSELTRLLDGWRRRDSAVLVPPHESKAMTYYALSLAHLVRRDHAAAREALEAALVEDFSFAMAHAVLAELHVEAQEMIAALREYELAVQLRESDPALRYRYAATLFRAGRYDEAEREFRRVIALEPFLARAYLPLAAIVDERGHTADAEHLYSEFLARAPRSLERQIAIATERLEELRRSRR